MIQKQRTLHEQVRIVYRACRKLYGAEHTQDQCLRVFKVIYPEIYRAQTSDIPGALYSVRKDADEQLSRIVASWNPDLDGKLFKLLMDAAAITNPDHMTDKETFINSLWGILPVGMRIRKLTPRECFRLMGVRDEEIDRIQATGIPDSKQYKLAGNSIVTDTLEAVFSQLFFPAEQPTMTRLL